MMIKIMGNKVTLKVSDDTTIDDYYHISKDYISILYKINNYKYQFTVDGYLKQSLTSTDDISYFVSFQHLEAKFVKNIQNRSICIERRSTEFLDVESTTDKTVYIKQLKPLVNHDGSYDFRVVIC